MKAYEKEKIDNPQSDIIKETSSSDDIYPIYSSLIYHGKLKVEIIKITFIGVTLKYNLTYSLFSKVPPNMKLQTIDNILIVFFML